jgi:hypothetical protein
MAQPFDLGAFFFLRDHWLRLRNLPAPFRHITFGMSKWALVGHMPRIGHCAASARLVRSKSKELLPVWRFDVHKSNLAGHCSLP